MARRAGPTLIQRSRRISPQTKATFHQVTGAGRRKVLRPFLGLTDAELTRISERLDIGIRRNASKPTS